MASVYKKGKRIYMSWYDTFENKPKNKSLGLIYNKENLIKAKKFGKEFQKALDEEKEKISKLKLVKDSLGNAMKHFYRNNSNKHPKTIEEYDWFFEKFNKHFPKEESCTQLTKLSCEEWLTSLRETSYQQNTLFKLSKVLKKLLKFLFEYNYVQMFILNSDIVFRREVKPIIVFSDEDLVTLIDGLKKKNNNFITTFYLLIYTGLRPSDIDELTTNDIDVNRKTISYYSPKTNEHFKIPIHEQLLPFLTNRIEEIKEGKLLEYETINNIGKAFRRYLEQLDLTGKGYNLRTFRKTFISLAHDSGIDLATVSKLVGHKQITTTQIHYNQLSISKQTDELKKFKLISKPQKD